TALWLAQKGKKVTVVEMMNEILGGHGALPHMNHDMLVDLLKFHDVKIYTSAQITRIEKDAVLISTEKNPTITVDAQLVVSAVGYKENNNLYQQIKTKDIPVHNVGDSQSVHNIMYAIWNAYEVARGI
ncbi:MAG: FAD-dependent oxidoreductase, partial [Clostridium sp.]